MLPEHAILFEPLEVKGRRLKNRIVVPPMATNRDIVGDDGIEWYRRLAEGGAALVIVEGTPVSRFGEDLTEEGLRRLAEAIHEGGALAAIQLFMDGRARGRGPSDLSREEIAEFVRLFREAAAICAKSGFDAVEPHGAHGFLLNQFFSPLKNRREDEYGGDLEGRGRLGAEIVKAIREEVGDALLLLYRHTPVEEGGYTLEESLDFARRLVEAGLDILDLSPSSARRPGDLAEPFKRALAVPVITVGQLDVHERAVEALREGRADLVAIGRGLIADPYWPKKTEEGRLDDILRCKRCNEGCFGNLRRGLPVECAQWREKGPPSP